MRETITLYAIEMFGTFYRHHTKGFNVFRDIWKFTHSLDLFFCVWQIENT